MKRTQFEIAGVGFRLESFTQAALHRNEVLMLKPEPTNKFDPLAIAVYKGDLHIGYVPRTHNKQIIEQVKAGKAQCFVETCWQDGCWVDVVMTDEPDEPHLTAPFPGWVPPPAP